MLRHFNKTQLMAGLQCQKHLHLLMHHPDYASETRTPASITGEVVEQQAQREFPGAVSVQCGHGHHPNAQTLQFLDDPEVHTIFQATFSANNVRVFIDVLHRNPKGDQDKWDLIEIKAATSIKDHFIDDVAIQAKTAQQAGLAINRIKLMHINSQFVYQGNHNYDGLFIQEDITEQVQAHWHMVPQYLQAFQQLVAGPEPEVHISSHCKTPNPCEFRHYCETQEPPYPVGMLPRGQHVVPQLLTNGITDIRDIPVDMLSSDTHIRVRNITIEGKAELLPGAKQILSALPYPRYYLDFESIQFAIPIWPGTQPYQQLPFQWSCHIEKQNGELQHKEFLDVSGKDPRRNFAAQLIDACQQQGPIIVYNQSFEKRIISELAMTFPDLQAPLLALNERIFDLRPVTEANYYHPDMKGSWSIKSVLPCLVPELSYSNLGEVQDGTQAQKSYLDIISNTLDEQHKQQLIHDLRNYCQLDTMAMVEIVRRLLSS